MSIGRLRRHLDLDAIARVKAGIRHKPQPVKRVAKPRKANTYRGARRNAVLRGDPPGVWKGVQAVRLVGGWSESKTYKPNGERECKRRRRQMERRAARG